MMRRLRRFTYKESSDSNIQDWAIKQLEKLPLDNLREICFDHTQELDKSKWAEIDNILAGDKFKSIKTVEVRPKSILQYLPKLEGRGVLRLYHGV